MPKRNSDKSWDGSPKKRALTNQEYQHSHVGEKSIVTDNLGRKWQLGKEIGVGGFGVIYTVFEYPSIRKEACYVVKLEKFTSGPLFVEINCYLRIAKLDMITNWKNENKLTSLPIPHYVASGSYTCTNKDKYRFLILPKFDTNLEQIRIEKKKFNMKTVLLLASQILEALKYIHHKGYIHSDIKASNIVLNKTKQNGSTYSKSPIAEKNYLTLRNRKAKVITSKVTHHNLRKTKTVNYCDDDWSSPEDDSWELEESSLKTDQICLIDFGLASKYSLVDGVKHDERKANAGTPIFCSRDAYKGIQSRRSDLESLAYNMVYWLTGSLPWTEGNTAMIEKIKNHCFADIEGFLCFCFSNPPNVLRKFFKYIKSLEANDAPDYDSCQNWFKKTLRELGYQDDDCFDFDNLEGWGKKQKKMKGLENKMPGKISNFNKPRSTSIKHLLRKKLKTEKAAARLNWSKMLTDPELLFKYVKDRNVAVNTEASLKLDELDFLALNPTPAMIEVYEKFLERNGSSPRYRSEEYENLPEGYTPAMASVLRKKKEQRALEDSVISPKPVRVTRSKKLKGNRRSSIVPVPKAKKSKVTKKKNKSLSTRSSCLRG